MQRDSSPPVHPRIAHADLDPDAVKVVRRLARSGFAGYFVGGCVRDLLVGLRPKDFDVATDARPRQVKRLFRNSRIIGRRFRLVHVHFGPHVIEVSTFRAPPPQEGEDLYIRRDNVFGTEEEDAHRRDFTINGLFYDVVRDRVIDHVGGLADLEARVVRTIGDPEVRLREDPVRILRAAKFAGRLGFSLDEGLRSAARRHAADLTKSPPARLLEEFYRLLSGRGAAQSFRVLEDLSSLSALLPEISPPPERFHQALERLEQRTGGERNALPQSLLLAVLLSPAALPAVKAAEPHEREDAVLDAILPPASRLGAARRDVSRARQTLALQARLEAPPEGRSARRIASREVFGEALELRRILGTLADGSEDDSALEAWERLREEAGPAEDDAGEAGDAPRRRRRRRRGGRRRRKRRKTE